MTLRSSALFVVLCSGIFTVCAPGRVMLVTYQIAVFALALVAVIQGICRRCRLAPAAWLPLIALAIAPLIGVIQISTHVSAYSWITLVRTLEWTAIVGVFGLVCTFHEAESRAVLKAILWFSFLLAVIATLQYFTAPGVVFWVFEIESKTGIGPFPNRNHWAAFIELALPVAIYQLVLTHRNTWVYCLMVGTMYASVVAGASRAGVILCTAGLLVVPVLLFRHGIRPMRFAVPLAAALSMAFILTWVVGPYVLWAHFTESDPYRLRREFLLSSIAMFREHPWSGFGLGTWASVYPQFAVMDPGLHANEAHNEWAQWAVEGGIPLLLIMSGVTVWAVRRVLRSPWALGVLLVLLHSWVEYPFERQALAGWFAAMLGLLAAKK